MRTVDTGLTFSVRPLETDIRASVAQERLTAMLAGFFGAIRCLDPRVARDPWIRREFCEN